MKFLVRYKDYYKKEVMGYHEHPTVKQLMDVEEEVVDAYSTNTLSSFAKYVFEEGLTLGGPYGETRIISPYCIVSVEYYRE